MSDWKEIYSEKLLTVEQAAQLVEPGDRIFAGGSGSLPAALIDAVCDRTGLHGVKLVTAVNGTDCKALSEPSCFGRVEYNSLFLGAADRANLALDGIHINSVQFHQAIETLREVYRVNTLMLEVSEPDEEGFLYYGTRGCAWGVLDRSADKVILQVNKYQQRAEGIHNRIHVSDVTALCRFDHPLKKYQYKYSAATDERIAAHILPYIKDGYTLQVGIGGIPNTVAYGLRDRKDLGIYTEVLTDAQLELMRVGAVDLSRVEASFILDSPGHVDEELLRHIRLSPLNRLNDPMRAAQHPHFISVNACLLADLTGQICSEAIDGRQYSGVGGQLDFVRAAARSAGGMSFLCLRSTHTHPDGTVSSNIFARLPAGTVITTPRTDVMNVVTEWGVAELRNKPLEDRVCAMIGIAHPDFRRALAEEAIACGLLHRERAKRDIDYC